MEILNICLSDIPKEKITTGKNGKKCCTLIVSSRKDKDQYGNDLSVSMGQSKEERESKSKKVYVGSGVTKSFDDKKEEKEPELRDQTDDLPF